MTSINNSSLYGGQYYPITTNSLTNGSSATSPASVPTFASDNSAYTLSLSPQAQQYLSGLNNDSTVSNSNEGFALSSADQQKLETILQKYKNLPVTQENYNKLQDELKAAGLAPDQLSAKDQVASINTTQLLLDALNGNDSTGIDPAQESAKRQAKANNYMQNILTAWKNAAPADTATPAATA